jgi:phosphoribosylformylglycinamidine synthase II
MALSDYAEDAGVEVPVRRILLSKCTDGSLIEISKAMGIGLSLEEIKRIRDHFKSEGREPTDVELEALGQAWSEHCCYKSSKYYMRKYFFGIGAPYVISSNEDAGVVEFDDEYAYVIGLESHNHPSAIGPYGGAATGVGGIIRDVVCMGAQPIAVVDPLFFGPLDMKQEDVPPGIRHPRSIFGGVVAGIRDYGNRIGIPTISGMVSFHPGYAGNPLVNVAAIGICKKKHVIHSRVGGPGEIYILAGGRTGRDGIHGVTFASADLSRQSEDKDRGSVQLGDPITKEPLIHACLEANEKGLLRGMKDLGGGGLSCVSGEMALAGGCGALIDLENVPTKEPGMFPWEIWVSESQERMMVTVLPKNVEAVLQIFRKWDVVASIVGKVVEGGRITARWKGKPVLDLDLEFFTGGPEYCRTITPRKVERKYEEVGSPALDRAGLERALLSVLADPNIACKEPVFRTYDHEVRGRTVIKPGVGRPFATGPSDASVLKPLEHSNKGLAVTADVNPYHCEIDPLNGTMASIEESFRNLVCVGARPHSLTDCLNYGNPEKPDRMGDFASSCEGIGTIVRRFGIPVVSGNVSLYNETEKGNVPPTPTIVSVGLIDDIDKCITSDLKEEGNMLYLVGRTRKEMGGSAYYRYRGLRSSCVPSVDLDLSERTIEAMLELNESELIVSAHDLSEGGLAVSMAEMCIGGGLGAEILISGIGEFSGHERMRDDTRLFSESCSRYIIEVRLPNAGRVEDCLSRHQAPYVKLGTVIGENLTVIDGDKTLMDIPVLELERAWRDGLGTQLEGSS